MATPVLPQESRDANNFSYQAAQFISTWGPRVIVAAVAGYYSLGIAYATGLMASIDSVAIPILVDSVGYAGLGAVMPTFQWYSAWTVRTIAALGAGIIYDVVERLAFFIYSKVQGCFSPPQETPISIQSPALQV